MQQEGADLFTELAWRGLVHDATPQLPEKLATARFAVYHGIDATADSLHVGNLLGVITLQRFQRAGHRPIACLGGATSMVGDPSGRSTERIMMDRDQIVANAEGIRRQLERFLEFGGGTDALLVNNADWLAPIGVIDFLRDVGTQFTVNVMIAKESVRARLEEREQGISYAEFSYMLLQAYDYLHLFDAHGCRLQIGGSDQWGNITAGIDLVRRARGAEVEGLTWPLITRADGTKFGKSEQGNVWLDPKRTSPFQFFQFWLNSDDRDAGRYLRLFTWFGRDRVEDLESALVERPEKREAQRALAFELTATVHGLPAAEGAQRASEALFGGDLGGMDEATLLDVFSEAPSSELPRSALGAGMALVELLAGCGLAPSRSAARTSVEQGGAYLNNRRETDVDRRVGEQDLLLGRYVVLRRGKRNYHLVRFV